MTYPLKKPWFRAKKYGYGWRLPATWQGWVVLIAYFAFVIGNFIRIDRYSHSASDTLRPYIIQTILISIIFLVIVYFTGEKPKWRFGK